MTDEELRAVIAAAVTAEREKIAAYVDEHGDPILADFIRSGDHLRDSSPPPETPTKDAPERK